MTTGKTWRWDWWLAHGAYMVSMGSTVFGMMYLLTQWSECVTVGRAALYFVIGIVAIFVCALAMECAESTDRHYKQHVEQVKD